jgi:hypothetical protein
MEQETAEQEFIEVSEMDMLNILSEPLDFPSF